jgi:hypothetical protein
MRQQQIFNLDECDNVYHSWLRSAFRPRQERVGPRSVLGPLARALAYCLRWCSLRLPDACHEFSPYRELTNIWTTRRR